MEQVTHSTPQVTMSGAQATPTTTPTVQQQGENMAVCKVIDRYCLIEDTKPWTWEGGQWYTYTPVPFNYHSRSNVLLLEQKTLIHGTGCFWILTSVLIDTSLVSKVQQLCTSLASKQKIYEPADFWFTKAQKHAVDSEPTKRDSGLCDEYSHRL